MCRRSNSTGDVPQRRVATAWIVEALDEIEDGKPCFPLRVETMLHEQFAFENRIETLAHRIIVTIT